MSLFKLVATFIIGVIVITIAIWTLIGFLCVKGCQAIQKDGVKGVAETVWNGTNAAVTTTNK